MKWTVRISKKEIHLNVFYLKPENYGCNKKKMDLLTVMEQIVEKAKGSKLGAEFYREANIYIGYVAERLEPQGRHRVGF